MPISRLTITVYAHAVPGGIHKRLGEAADDLLRNPVGVVGQAVYRVDALLRC